jgi:hypothetical protein
MYLDHWLPLLPGHAPASTVRGTDRQSPEYPAVSESDQPELARRVILELAREGDFYLWELSQRISQLLKISTDKPR